LKTQSSREKPREKPQVQRSVSFQLFLRILLAIVLSLFVAVAVMGTILSDALRIVLGTNLLKDGMIVRLLWLMQGVGLAGVVITLFIFFVVYIRGMSVYQRLVERVISATKNESVYNNLGLVSFPEEDILGTLGKELNRFFAHVANFDRLKTSALRRLQERFEFVADLYDKPLLLVHVKSSFPNPTVVIRFGNKAFLDLFARKENGEYYEVAGLGMEIDMEKELEGGVSLLDIFERITESELADNSFLGNQMILLKMKEVLATFEPRVLEEPQVMAPMFHKERQGQPILCKRIEFYPFLDVFMGENGKVNRVLKDILVVFAEYQVEKEGLFSSFMKRGEKKS